MHRILNKFKYYNIKLAATVTVAMAVAVMVVVWLSINKSWLSSIGHGIYNFRLVEPQRTRHYAADLRRAAVKHTHTYPIH